MSAPNDLNVARQTLGEWLRGDARLIIPHYQRKYCWTQGNCESLFEDVLKVAEGQRQRATHFFGTITLSPLRDRQFYVVDGQQRLTTLWIFAHLLSRVLDEGDSELPGSDFLAKRLTFEDPHDQKTWRHLLLDRFCDEESLNNDMVDNASWLRKRIEASKDVLRIAHAEHRLLEKLLLVRVVLPERLAPQRIFERMNGVKLRIEAMDLIKNFLLMECPAKEEQEKVYGVWENEFRDLGWMFQILVEALVCADLNGVALYREFRQLFKVGRFGSECCRVPALLEQFRVWFKGYSAANVVLETLTGGHGLPWRYRTLVMRTAMAFSGNQGDDFRPNKVLADVAEHILGRIASSRLLFNKLHRGSEDRAKCHDCLMTFNQGEPTPMRFEAAIAQHFAPIGREAWERGFHYWLQHEEPRPDRNWNIIGLGDDPASLDAKQMADRLEMRFKERRNAVGA